MKGGHGVHKRWDCVPPKSGTVSPKVSPLSFDFAQGTPSMLRSPGGSLGSEALFTGADSSPHSKEEGFLAPSQMPASFRAYMLHVFSRDLLCTKLVILPHSGTIGPCTCEADGLINSTS